MRGSFARPVRYAGVAVTICALVVGTLAILAPQAEATPVDPAYTAFPNQTWKVTGGQVYAMVRVGNQIVIGGTFTGLRSPSGVQINRSRIARVDPNTGEPDLLWDPGVDNTVRALATDGTHLFVGGAFTTIGGVARARLASLAASDGVVDSGFQADANGDVRSLLLANGKLYAGGVFTTVTGTQRLRLAAVSPTDGALDATWLPKASAAVNGLSPIPGSTQIAVGGEFSYMTGLARKFLASVDQDSGAVSAWAPEPTCLNPLNPCIVLTVLATSALVYAGIAGPGGRAAAYEVSTGEQAWNQYGDGDVQALALIGNTLYAGGHFDPFFGYLDSENLIRYEVAAMDATTGRMLPFAPNVIGGTGVWTMLAESDGLRIGGAFTAVNGDLTIKGFAVFPLAVTLVAAGAEWAYRDDGIDLSGEPEPLWTSPAYNDSSWARGSAELGYGDGDEVTTVASGHVTYYFRRAFTVPEGVTPTALQLQVIRDDGAVVYLNGVEVWRNNMPSGPINGSTLATSALSGSAETTWNPVTIPATALQAGSNVITVEVHNASATSSDLSMDLRLTTA